MLRASLFLGVFATSAILSGRVTRNPALLHSPLLRNSSEFVGQSWRSRIESARRMQNDHNGRSLSSDDTDYRRMMKWVFIALVVVVALAIVVVELTLRWFEPS